MKKLKLVIQDLSVESFPSDDRVAGLGTIGAHAIPAYTEDPYNGACTSLQEPCERTLYFQLTCNYTSRRLCCQ